MAFRPDTYEPHPGEMDACVPTYSPYRAGPQYPIEGDLRPPPTEREPEPEPVQARYMYLTDTMFEEVMEELPRPAPVSRPMIEQEPSVNGAPERLDGVLGHAPPMPAPLEDDPLEQLLGRIGPLGPGMM